jgi:hypothetical protein
VVPDDGQRPRLRRRPAAPRRRLAEQRGVVVDTALMNSLGGIPIERSGCAAARMAVATAAHAACRRATTRRVIRRGWCPLRPMPCRGPHAAPHYTGCPFSFSPAKLPVAHQRAHSAGVLRRAWRVCSLAACTVPSVVLISRASSSSVSSCMVCSSLLDARHTKRRPILHQGAALLHSQRPCATAPALPRSSRASTIVCPSSVNHGLSMGRCSGRKMGRNGQGVPINILKRLNNFCP